MSTKNYLFSHFWLLVWFCPKKFAIARKKLALPDSRQSKFFFGQFTIASEQLTRES